jgi:hypothetical protein
MARSESWVPGIVGIGANHTLPTGVPAIDRVVSATITRIRAGLGIPNHAQADIVAALANHPVHAHDLVSQGLGGPVANALGLPAGLNVLNDAGAAALHTVPGAGATGVQNNAAAQAHAAGGAPVAHGASTGADPVVAAVPTKVDATRFTLDVATTMGDILTLVYEMVGARVVP